MSSLVVITVNLSDNNKKNYKYEKKTRDFKLRIFFIGDRQNKQKKTYTRISNNFNDINKRKINKGTQRL